MACLSIVATETSTLTFISIPGLAYISGLGFMQIVFGYLIGRLLVCWLLLPRYFEGEITTVYGFLQNRFGLRSRKVVALVFQVTRLLADGVRLFATAIPLAMLAGIDQRLAIVVLAVATAVYTLYGGIRRWCCRFHSVCRVLLCAVAGLYVIGQQHDLPAGLSALPRELFTVFDLHPHLTAIILYRVWPVVLFCLSPRTALIT
jgi:uncharacterized sodium:solute symporter family permease YidK